MDERVRSMASLRRRAAAKFAAKFAAWRDDRRGATAMIFALAIPVFMGAMGIAVDYAKLSSTHGAFQSAVDSAALSAAREMRLASLSAMTVQQDAQNFALANVQGTGVSPQASATADLTNRQITVTISTDVPTYIMKYLGSNVVHVSATATARIKGGDPLCMLGLNTKATFTLDADLNANLQAAGCVVYSDSTASNGLVAKQNATVTAALICSAGGKSGTGAGSFSPTPQTDCPVMPDPLAGRPTPSIGACSYNNLVVSGQATTLYPGTYCGGLTINNNSNVTMASGAYIIKDGPLDVTGGATMNGQNVGFYFTGSNAVLDLQANSNISLTAPKSGVMAGMLFWEDAAVKSNQTHQILSNNARTLLGTIYFPINTFYIAANAPVADQSAYTVVVASQIWLYGGPTMVLNTNYFGTDIPVPDGVGPNGAAALVR